MRRRKKDPGDDSNLRPVVGLGIAEMERRRTLRKAVVLRMECRKLVAERDAVWAELMKSNDVEWFDKFAMKMLRAKRSVHENLQSHFDVLDKRLRTLVVRIRELAQQVFDLGLTVDIRPRPVTAGTGTSSDLQGVGLGRNVNPAPGYRDFLIRSSGNLSNAQLCGRLDFYLDLARDQPAIGLPENWVTKFGVKKYSEAYEDPKCRALVQKLIAKVKHEL